MHILVTGGCGYIGSVLTPKLLDLGHKVTVVDIMWFGNQLKPHKNLSILNEDIRNTNKTTLDKVDTVIHLANIANDPCGDLDATVSWEINVLASMQLIEHAIKNNVKQFIYASSGSVYGVKDDPKVTEDLPLIPISNYNKTKMIAERVLLSYKDSISLQCIRPATVCGYSPRMRLDVAVNMLTLQALTKEKITVFGGEQERPNIHIQDITDVFIHFLEHGKTYPGIYNAGFENLSIMNIARTVAKFIPAEIVVTESNDPRSYKLNSDKLLKTGFNPKFGVEKAIKELISKYNDGKITDSDTCYNIKQMKKITNL